MSAKQNIDEVNEKSVDTIIESLTGDLRLGQRYYIFTVTYAYIGTVSKITERCVIIDPAIIVSQAGSENDAVSKIVAGKKQPESCEECPSAISIWLQAITASIPMKK